MNTETVDDPFERAVRREGILRKRIAAMPDQAAVMRFIALWMLVLAGTWAVILAGHWLIFPEPRWLAVLHTVVFALMVALGVISYFAQRQLVRYVTPASTDDIG